MLHVNPESAGPDGRRHAQARQESPVPKRNIDDQHRGVGKFLVRIVIALRQIPDHVPIDPTSRSHHHRLRAKPVQLTITRIRDGDTVRSSILDAYSRRSEPNANVIAFSVQLVEGDVSVQGLQKRVTRYGMRDELFDEVTSNGGIPSRKRDERIRIRGVARRLGKTRQGEHAPPICAHGVTAKPDDARHDRVEVCADILRYFQNVRVVGLEGHRVEPGICPFFRRRFRFPQPAKRRLHLVSPRGRAQACFPDVLHPGIVCTTKKMTHIEGVPDRIVVVVERDTHALGGTLGLSELEITGDVQRREIVIRLPGLSLDGKIVGALWSREVNPIDLELVSFSLATEDRMVVEKDRFAARVETTKVVRSRQSRKPRTDHGEVVDLSGLDRIQCATVEGAGTYLVRDPNELRRIAVRRRVVADAARAIPIDTELETIIRLLLR